MIAFDVSGSIRTVMPGPLDYLRGPYPDLASANAAIPNQFVEGKSYREGKEVEIGTNNVYATYWWSGGYGDGNLVPKLVKGDQGDKGWSPVFAIVPRGDDRVFKLTDYAGGSGTKPDNFIGMYLATTGYVADINEAINVRGLQGLSAYEVAVKNGFIGTEAEWEQFLRQPALDAAVIANEAAGYANDRGDYAESEGYRAGQAADAANTAAGRVDDVIIEANQAIDNANDAADDARLARPWNLVLANVPDGAARVVQQIADLWGGTGIKPTEYIGKYLGPGNTYVNTAAEATSIQGQQGIAGPAGGLYNENVTFTANKTLATSDGGKYLIGNSTSDLFLTIPNTSNVNIPVGTRMLVEQNNVGRIVVAGQSGVTVQAPGNMKLSNLRYSQFWLYHKSANVWTIEGRLVMDALLIFKAAVLADGGTIDEALLNAEFALNIPTFRSRAVVLLICGAWKTNTIYGFNPQNGDVIPFTFGRAGTAQYWDNAGIMQTAVAGQMRINYDPSPKTLIGLQEENTGTNLCTYSGLTNGLAGLPTSGGVRTAVDTLWNKGALLSKGIKFDRDGINPTYGYKSISGLSLNTNYCLSFFIKMEDGSAPVIGTTTITGDFGLIMYGIFALPGSYTIVNMGDGLYRIYVFAQSASSTSGNFGITKYVGQSVKTFTVTGFQVELGSVPTSYVETTTGQVTRIADTFRSANDVSPYNTASIYMDVVPLVKNTAPVTYLIMKSASTVPAHLFFYVNFLNAQDTSLHRTARNGMNGGRNKAMSSYSPAAGMKMAVNGSAVITDAAGVASQFNNGSITYFTTAGAEFVSNHIRCFAVFPEQLTDAEHTAITT